MNRKEIMLEELEANKFEIKYREILMKKLKSIRKSLNKAVEAENLKAEMRSNELSTYKTEEEIQDAYGYGLITDEERYILLGELERKNAEITPNQAALDELNSIICNLMTEIREFTWLTLTDVQKENILKKNEEYKNTLKMRRS